MLELEYKQIGVKRMKLLYCYGANSKMQDILWGFIELGVEIVMLEKEVDEYATDEKLELDIARIENKAKVDKCDGILSWNYIPAASVVGERLGIPYISWIYDSPLIHVYSKTMHNSCNHIFVFDKVLCKDIKDKGGNIYYLPLAANTTRLGAMNITDEQIKHFSEDVSFVGSLYNRNPYNDIAHKLSEQSKKKHEDVFCKQYGNWKENLLNTCISDEDMDELERISPIAGIEQYPYISKRSIYLGFILARKMAEYERTRILNTIGEKHRIVLYNSKDDKSELKNIICKPSVEYEYETPIVYFSSKINLNMTLRSIESGLPLRVFDVLGVGGFLLSNYQKEFEDLFVPDKEVVLYSSVDEMMDKIEYYLNHERERLTIAMNGYKRIVSEHNMKRRAATILKTVFNL